MNIFRAAKMTPDYGFLRKGWLQKVTIFILSLTVQILVVRWFWLKNVQVSHIRIFSLKICERISMTFDLFMIKVASFGGETLFKYGLICPKTESFEQNTVFSNIMVIEKIK